MSSNIRSAQRITRRTALVLAFICLWLSGGATLHHTDELDFGTPSTGHHAVGHLLPAVPPIPCAACEWEQMAPTLQTPVIFVHSMPFTQIAFAAITPNMLHIRCFDYFSPRGPPV